MKKLFAFIILFLVAPQLNANNFSPQILDYYRVQGHYKIETTDIDNPHIQHEDINRLAIFKSFNNEQYTISLANGDTNTTYLVFTNVTPIFTETEILFKAKGDISNGRFGHIELKFKRDTLELEATLHESSSEEIKHIRGTPIYNLNDCIFRLNTTPFSFPKIETLLGTYEGEIGEDDKKKFRTTMLIQQFPEGELTLNVKIFLDQNNKSSFEFRFKPGVYKQELGLLSFPFDSQTGVLGRGNLTFWIDKNAANPGEVEELIQSGKALEPKMFYLKFFAWGSGGGAFIKKFRKIEKEETISP